VFASSGRMPPAAQIAAGIALQAAPRSGGAARARAVL